MFCSSSIKASWNAFTVKHPTLVQPVEVIFGSWLILLPNIGAMFALVVSNVSDSYWKGYGHGDGKSRDPRVE